MRRVMLDTNVYERLLRIDLDEFSKQLGENEIIMYGCRQIREELRAIPKTIVENGKSFRNALLSIYDHLVEDRSFPAEELSYFLAEEYWKEYQGGVPKRKIRPDFVIVAVASIHHLDVVVSEDFHSMKSIKAINAYKIVNERNGLEMPRFLQFQDFML